MSLVRLDLSFCPSFEQSFIVSQIVGYQVILSLSVLLESDNKFVCTVLVIVDCDSVAFGENLSF